MSYRLINANELNTVITPEDYDKVLKMPCIYADLPNGLDNNHYSLPKWIPVSERLPKVNQKVLVTSYGRVCYAMMISADGNNGHPVFKLQDSLNERVVYETTVHNEFTTSRITAWMPLPKSYRVESENEGK